MVFRALGASGEPRATSRSSPSSWCPGRVTMHGRTVVPALGYGSPVNVQMVDRWRTSDQKLRWCASAVWATERQFRRVKPYRHLPLLKQALHRTLTTTTSAAA